MSIATDEMPLYQCHKRVRALKIKDIAFIENNAARISTDDSRFDSFDTGPGYRERYHGNDEDKGYIVVYEDGYVSWSPTKAFEEGYTKVDS